MLTGVIGRTEERDCAKDNCADIIKEKLLWLFIVKLLENTTRRGTRKLSLYKEKKTQEVKAIYLF